MLISQKGNSRHRHATAPCYAIFLVLTPGDFHFQIVLFAESWCDKTNRKKQVKKSHCVNYKVPSIRCLFTLEYFFFLCVTKSEKNITWYIQNWCNLYPSLFNSTLMLLKAAFKIIIDLHKLIRWPVSGRCFMTEKVIFQVLTVTINEKQDILYSKERHLQHGVRHILLSLKQDTTHRVCTYMHTINTFCKINPLKINPPGQDFLWLNN